MRLAVGHAILDAPVDDAVATSPVNRNRVTLSVVPALTAVTAEDISDLSPGDILASDTLVDGEVFLRIGDEARFAARLARSNGRRVAIITRRIPDTTTTGDHSPDEQ
jgi:flagellar motor switch protein FliM